MSKDGKKAAAVAGGLAVLTGLLVALATRKKAPPGEQFGASISMLILDAATGEPVPKNSPALVLEGSSYIARFTVTNRSTRLGALVDANLGITIAGVAGSTVIPFPAMWVTSFSPGQAVSWDITFTIPDNTGGQTGSIVVEVWPPSGPALASAQEPLTIGDISITYGATITPLQVL